MRTLLVPELGRGRGTGHLRRSLSLLEEMPDSVILLPAADTRTLRGLPSLGDLTQSIPANRIVSTVPRGVRRAVLDLFAASASDVLSFGSAVTVGVDLGGAGRNYCSFLVDTLPREDNAMTNIADSACLEVPQWAPISEEIRGHYLITFGGEDPAGLSEATARALVERVGIDPRLLTVVAPGLRSLGPVPRGVKVIDSVPSLVPVFMRNEWVLCSFGLTAYEAAAAGRRVVTIAPTRYHDRLARRAGFARAGIGHPAARRVRRALARGRAAPVPPDREDTAGRKGNERLGALIAGIAEGVRTGCPVHVDRRGPAVWRGPGKSYFRCPVCGTIYMERFTADEERYGSAYFEDEYRAQYGRTYLDDFESIRRTGHRRLKEIRSVAPSVASVLDIGCAYGPFLAAATDLGIAAWGVDVSTAAVDYVRNTFGLPAHAGSVLELDPENAFGKTTFDVVTLWYVIEHFPDLRPLFDRLTRWVRPGGVLAIGTPSGVGVSARRNRDAFFAASPRDHYTIWSRRSAETLLAEHGFAVRRIRHTGHHPERYPAVRRHVVPAWAAALHSRVFGWGDTFEIYAIREEP